MYANQVNYKIFYFLFYSSIQSKFLVYKKNKSVTDMLYLIIPSILIMIMLISSILMLVFGIKNLPKKYPSNDISPRFLNREAWGVYQ